MKLLKVLALMLSAGVIAGSAQAQETGTLKKLKIPAPLLWVCVILLSHFRILTISNHIKVIRLICA
jgi:hypothetical protein